MKISDIKPGDLYKLKKFDFFYSSCDCDPSFVKYFKINTIFLVLDNKFDPNNHFYKHTMKFLVENEELWIRFQPGSGRAYHIECDELFEKVC